MDIRAHADMASLPMSSSTHSNFMQSGAILQQQAEAVANPVAVTAATTGTTGAANSGSSTKLKINITSGAATRTGTSSNNNGLAATQIPSNNNINSTAGNGINSAGSANPNPNPNQEHHDLKLPSSMELKASKKPVRYRECQKNHAANIGGHANDGCGEFMPSGEEGTLEALRCAACGCHRNFHRREVEGEEPASCDCRYGGGAAASSRDHHHHRKRIMEQSALYATPPSHIPLLPSPAGMQLHPAPIGGGGGGSGVIGVGIGRGPPPPHLIPAPPSQMIMAFNSHDPDDYDTGMLSPHSSLKKRFRTKFTSEQKEQMHVFAEKIGWRIQKQDEEAVQQFCAEVGVKRHVLKVWMHNNKNTFVRKQSNSVIQPNNSNNNDNNNNTACISTASIGSEDEMRSS